MNNLISDKRHLACHTRWMIKRDMSEVMDIVVQNFLDITEDEMTSMLRERNNIPYVVELKDEVIGFMICKNRKRSIELLIMGINNSYKRVGIGTTLIKKLKSKLSIEGRLIIRATIPETNIEFAQFLNRNGFEAKLYRNAYENCDGYGFEYILEDSYVQF